jgi:hypothetical protein
MKYTLPALFLLSCLNCPGTSLARTVAAQESSLDVVSKFTTLLDQDKKYQEAADFLEKERFQFTSPKANFNGTKDWLHRFPKVHKNAPTFSELKPGAHANQVIRDGTKKVGFLTIHLRETYELNEDGKIVRISAALKKN